MTPKTGSLLSRLIGKIPALLVVVAVGGIVATMVIALAPSPTAYADHNSTRIICPDPIEEGNTGSVGVRRSGYKVEWVYFATDHQYHTASSDDYEEYHGVKFENDAGSNSVWAPVVTKEDTLPEHDETFEIGFWGGGTWHHCVVTIVDDDAPEIVGVDIASSPIDRYAYRAGDSIDIAVDLDSKVDVAGTPLLSLYIGDGEESTWRGAEYHSGSGTRSLLFRYQVQPEDFDSDGISVAAASSNDDGSPAQGFTGDIYAAGTDVQINYSHPSLQGASHQKVDGRPYVQSARITSSPPDGWDAYHANQVIEVSLTFDMDVVVEGDVSVELHLGAVDYISDDDIREATYLRGTGTDTLVFGYTVQPGDTDSEGVGIVMGTLRNGFSGHGTIKAKGKDVERNPYYLGTDNQPDHRVDTEPPTISSVSIVSRPSDGDAYRAGEVVNIEMVFSEEVTVIGYPHLALEIGSTTCLAALPDPPQTGFTSSLVFQYEVQSGDTDSNGIGIDVNSLGVSIGAIYDRAGNTADLSHPAIPVDMDQRVEARHTRRP